MFINNLVEDIASEIRLYAEYTSLYIDYNNPINAGQKLQEDIHKIELWATRWFVSFNPSKTESLIFSRKRRKIEPHLKMGNTQISEVNHHKHLGVTLQKDGRWGM